MSVTDHDPTTPGAAPATTSGRSLRWSPRRTGVALVVLSFVGIWGYVMYLSIFVGRAEPRDRLEDVAWTESAEQTCAGPRATIDQLPFANELDSTTERADVLDEATDVLEVMVTRLDGLLPPSSAEEAAAVDKWLADYRTYLDDRRAYAERFRSGLDEPFRVTDRGGFQIDVLIDDFAHVNYMESCETPNDVG